MSNFLVLTQLLPKKVIDRGENCILLKYTSNTPIFDTNCMDLHTIKKSVFQATNFSFTPREIFESVWSYKQNKLVAKLLSATVSVTNDEKSNKPFETDIFKNLTLQKILYSNP